ncbi:MAG: hypothetical protein DLD55_04045 [candidate division SR1 bacterium]|nr:MAG: hypothetical protein DLD55_04045 [candidate division SR1 bacterium]
MNMGSQPNSSFQIEIPSIDGKRGAFQPQAILQQERAKLDRLVNAPNDISGWSLLGKMVLGVIVGAMMSLILVLVMSAFGLAVKGEGGGTGVGIEAGTHPLARLILAFLGFLITFFGSQILVLLYGVFFSHKYTQQSKTSGLLLLTNTVLFAFMMGVFVLLGTVKPGAEVVLFVLYVCIAVFLSFAQIEFVVNPNYASSSLAGCTIGFMLSLIVAGVLWKGAIATPDVSAPYMLVWISTLIVFPLMIFGQGIREIIYYKIYETGANPFYIPSQAELDTQTILDNQKQEAKDEAVNVEF